MIFSLISYDISDDDRRTRIHDLLRNHGLRVQKSVFECRLPEKKLNELQVKLGNLMNPNTDSVRIYRLCKRCLFSVEAMGTGSLPDDEHDLPSII